MPGRSPVKPAAGRAVARAAILAAVLLLCWPGAASAGHQTQAAGDWTRWKYDAGNTGMNLGETRLGPGNVRGLRRSWFRSLCCGGGTPLVAGGVVYVTGGDAKMRALDAATGRLLWRAYVTRTEGATGAAAVSGGLAYVVSGDSVLLAKDVANGVNRWKALLADGGGRGRPVGTVSVRSGRAFVATEDGSVLAYAAAGCRPALVCRPLWVGQGGASSPFDSTPAVGRTTIFVGAPNRLHALDAKGERIVEAMHHEYPRSNLRFREPRGFEQPMETRGTPDRRVRAGEIERAQPAKAEADRDDALTRRGHAGGPTTSMRASP